MSNDGGINALRGFRKQFLHTLRRIVTAENDECFYPEGIEDIDVYDSNAQLLERVQVKDYKDPLTKGDIDTFLKRSIVIAEENKEVTFVLASYGELGSELGQLIEFHEKTIKKPKFKNYQKVLQRFHFKKLDEQNELAVIKNFLANIPMLT